MTDRLKGVLVTFDKDIREDDAEGIIEAIRHIRHVLGVDPIVADSTDWMARVRVRSELSEALFEVLESVREGSEP